MLYTYNIIIIFYSFSRRHVSTIYEIMWLEPDQSENNNT